MGQIKALASEARGWRRNLLKRAVSYTVPVQGKERHVYAVLVMRLPVAILFSY